MEVDPRFEPRLPTKTPWKEITLSFLLFFLGISMYTIALLTHNGHIHPDRVSVSAQTRAHARAKSERLWANRGVCPQVESMHDSLRLCQPEYGDINLSGP